MARRCETCIFRPAMRRLLGRSVEALIRQARAADGFVVCHETLPAWNNDAPPVPGAICHGYARAHPDTYALRTARALGRLEPVDPPGPLRDSNK